MLLKYSLIAVLPLFAALSAASVSVDIKAKDNGSRFIDVPDAQCTPKTVKEALKGKIEEDVIKHLVFCDSMDNVIGEDGNIPVKNGAITSGNHVEIVNPVNGENLMAHYCAKETYDQLLERVKGPDHKLLVEGVESLGATLGYILSRMAVFPNDHVWFTQPSRSSAEQELQGFAKCDPKSIREAVLEKSKEAATEETSKRWMAPFKHPQDIAVPNTIPVSGKQLELSKEYVVVGDRDGSRLVTILKDETYEQLTERLYGDTHAYYKAQVKDVKQKIESKYKLSRVPNIEKYESILFVAEKDGKAVDFVYNFDVDNGMFSKYKITGVAPCELASPKGNAPLTADLLTRAIVKDKGWIFSDEKGNLEQERITLPICSGGKPLDVDAAICGLDASKKIDPKIAYKLKVEVEGHNEKDIFFCPQSTIGDAAEQIQKVYGIYQDVYCKKGQADYAPLNPIESLKDFESSSWSSTSRLYCRFVAPSIVVDRKPEEGDLTPAPLIEKVEKSLSTPTSWDVSFEKPSMRNLGFILAAIGVLMLVGLLVFCLLC